MGVQRFDDDAGPVEKRVHVEGIIEAGVKDGVCSDGLGIAKKLVPGLPLDEAYVGRNPKSLNLRFSRRENHGLFSAGHE
jgi:hypothetical protein